MVTGTFVLSACSSPVITTDDAAAGAVQTPNAPSSTQRPSNANLVNAFDFYSESGDQRPGYFFTSPSGSWRCVIIPHEQAGCQSVKAAARLGIKGVPDTVTAVDGTETAPNTLVLNSTGDPQFVNLDATQFTPVPGPAPTLQFGRILAAAGFRCNVQDLGISCLSETSGQGFTFSGDGYTPSYTDVPAAS
jgi:hypothetical protein